MDKKLNKKMAEAMIAVMRKHVSYVNDIRVYFNGDAWDLNEKGHKVIEDINPKDYFEYANPNTVSMTFEGEPCEVLYYAVDGHKCFDALNDCLKEFGHYFEFGNHWNLSLHEC